MAIPKVIYQTFKTSKLPWLTKWYIKRFRKNNPGYLYEFYDDERIEKFLKEDFGDDVLSLYRKINIGAAKADFFRYAILLKRGGIYVDIDSTIRSKLDAFINFDDTAIISRESNPNLFVQWALIYEAHHPFMQRTFDKVISNLSQNKYPHDVHRMTGPSVYTEALNECLVEKPDIRYRILGTDYNGHLKFKYRFSKLLYSKGEHWKKMQLHTPVINSTNEKLT